MDKTQLKQRLVDMNLDAELESLLIELVDGATEVNQTLLDVIAKVLETQAEFYENLADVLDEEADQYESLADALEVIDAEEALERVEAIKQNQDELISDLQKKMDELRGGGDIGSSEKTSQAMTNTDNQAGVQPLSQDGGMGKDNVPTPAAPTL